MSTPGAEACWASCSALDRPAGRGRAPLGSPLRDENVGGGFDAFRDSSEARNRSSDVHVHLCPESRALGYLGGDEFCVLTAAPADQHAELGALTRAALTEHGDGFAITAALGTATIDTPDSDWDDALRDADRRMYAEKNGLRESAGGQSAAVLLRVLTERHPGIGDHVDSVAALTEMVGLELDMTEDDLTTLWQAATLHDNGRRSRTDASGSVDGPSRAPALDDKQSSHMSPPSLLQIADGVAGSCRGDRLGAPVTAR